MFVSRKTRAVAVGNGIKFEGEGPFYLRMIEHVRASALENTVQITLFAQVEEKGRLRVQIETQMSPNVAVELANTLLRVANESAREIAN
jgi:hypothetical protein